MLLGVTPVPVAQAAAKVDTLKPAKTGELDCNGDSPTYKSVREMTCTDIKGILGVDNQNTWGGKFYDNGQYIGHDEPDTTFESSKPGSGGNISVHRDDRCRPERRADRQDPGKRRLALVRADACAVDVHGSVRSQLVSAGPVHAELRLQRADEHVQRRRVDVHGDAAVPTR